MSKEYEIECEYHTYFVEAEPDITDESFDHTFGCEKRLCCSDVKIYSVSRGETIISDKEFRADVLAFDDLLEQVCIDWAQGDFDE